MSVVVLTSANVAEVLTGESIVLIDFRASHCGACDAFDHIYDDAAKSYQDIVFAKVDIEDEPELADDFDINSVPTLVVIRDKEWIYSHVGTVTDVEMESLVQQVREG
ncbi:thioredoxin family protein [Lentzea sp. NPDC051213]|uniref:thioredoxin family protein n=1 Tax=Lentzea sp. NPDC051213 TaxID=3364126 RepID=UPI0037B786C4